MANNIIDSMLKFITKPWAEYGTESGKISQTTTYLKLTSYRARENKQTGQLELMMQFQTAQQLTADTEYVTGRYPAEWAPLIATAVNVSCMVDDVATIRGIAYSASADNPNQIRIKPTTNIPANAYIYLNASWPISVGGGQLIKNASLLRFRKGVAICL